MQIITCLLILISFASRLTSAKSDLDLIWPQDLLWPSILYSWLTQTLSPTKLASQLNSIPVFGPCRGFHEDIYDIDYDYTYTIPEDLKKSKDLTQLFIEGVMKKDAHVDKLHLNVYWNGNLFNV